MMQIIQQLFEPVRNRYSSSLERQQATLLFNLSILLVGFGSVVITFMLLQAILRLDLSEVIQNFPGAGVILIGSTIYILLRLGYLPIARYFLVISFMGLTSFRMFSDPQPALVILLFIIMLMIVLVLNWRFLILVYPIMLVLNLWNFYGVNTETSIRLAPIIPQDFLVISIEMAGFTGLLILLSRQLTASSRRLDITMSSLELMGQFEPDMTRTELELMASVIQFIQQLPQYQSAQVFMANDLQELSGRIHLELGMATLDTLSTSYMDDYQQSAIVEALSKLRSIVITPQSVPVRRAHLQPGSLSGVCVPLLANGRVLAVLDIQSDIPHTTSNQELEILQFIAAQATDKLLHKRHLSTLQSDLVASENIMLNQQRRLRDLEQLERQNVRETWGNFIHQGGDSILGFDFASDDTSPIPALKMSDVLEESLNQGYTQIEEDAQMQHVSIPINLRGQILGVIGLDIPAGRALNQRQIDMLENVMQRLALALENKRLYEQSQTQAQREIKASHIGDQLLASTDVETILQMAAARFNDTLGAIQTHIQIEPDILQTQQMSIVERED